jgi:hypothetical protein
MSQSETRALVMPGEMTMDRAVELINANHARTPLAADDIYVFRMVLSGQAIDSYQTRMSMSTLNNYAADFAQGRALMNSHRTGGWDGSAELPIGRTFAADLNGDFLPEDAPYEAAGGATLGVYNYIQRGLKLTDVSTDDAIRGIDGGTIRDASVGFSMVPNGMYRCSICGGDMADWFGDCSHVPGATYDEGRAFAWVENAHGREASLVYKGSNPQAMIDKAIRMAEAGRLSRRDALLLEEQWGARIVGGKAIPVSKLAPVGDTPITRKEQAMDWEKFLAELRAIDAAQADRIAALAEGERPGAVIAVLREQRTSIDGLTPRAAMGDKWLDDLVDQAVKSRVRAEANAFDGEKYRKLLRTGGDVDLIREEIASWERQAKAVLGDGRRPTVGKTDRPAPQRRVYK